VKEQALVVQRTLLAQAKGSASKIFLYIKVT